MLETLLRKVFGSKNDRELKRLQPIVDQINQLDFSSLSDEKLRDKTQEFKTRLHEATSSLRNTLEENQRQLAAIREQERELSAKRETRDLELRHREEEPERLGAELAPLDQALRQAVAEGRDGSLPEAFAAVQDVSERGKVMRHLDEQLGGGMVLHNGKIVEMKTGEGKTLCATLSLQLNAL